MEKLIEKTENLKIALDENSQVKKIRELNKKIMKDTELLRLIEKYNLTKNESIKQQIVKNELFREYKEAETNLNILILEINQQLKELNKKGKCSL